jgi:hypothetical protein
LTTLTLNDNHIGDAGSHHRILVESDAHRCTCATTTSARRRRTNPDLAASQSIEALTLGTRRRIGPAATASVTFIG